MKPMETNNSPVLTESEAQRALSEASEQYRAQSILTPMPEGTHDAGRVGPILPLHQARDVIAWHEDNRKRRAELSEFTMYARWISMAEMKALFPKGASV